MFVSNLLLFASLIVVLAFTPGPDVIYIITRGMAQGKKAALLSTVGICLGYLVYTMLAALGLSALLQSSPLAFTIVRYIGAIYLVYLGIRMFLSKAGGSLTPGAITTASAGRILQQGILTSMLNPKGILVFAALLPQFVNPHLASIPLQMIAFGLTFTMICLCIYGGYAYLSGSLREKLATQPRIASILKYLTGSVLIGLGVRLLFLERS
ncbi:lysine transporter LysE [Reticulibacter mediterranei]|uniref:Lysine transporter LysE n=1 Tax=Reticulibacter mediterranei TaxID=2778369 RepID=A0A8J3J3W3_9CHLR|nr:LysE family translocator [Reticulibacter mediterranei]GHP01087.1 lysine transporter LysE [Reticulibacter mediterranei]